MGMPAETQHRASSSLLIPSQLGKVWRRFLDTEEGLHGKSRKNLNRVMFVICCTEALA